MHRTNIELDEALVEQGLKLTRLKSKKALVHYALQEVVRRKRRKGLLKLAGKVKWEGDLEEMRGSRR